MSDRINSKRMKKRVYFVGFQTDNGRVICNTTLEWISEHTADAYKLLHKNLQKEIERIGYFNQGSVLINSITILFEEDVVEDKSQKNIKFY